MGLDVTPAEEDVLDWLSLELLVSDEVEESLFIVCQLCLKEKLRMLKHKSGFAGAIFEVYCLRQPGFSANRKRWKDTNL